MKIACNTLCCCVRFLPLNPSINSSKLVLEPEAEPSDFPGMALNLLFRGISAARFAVGRRGRDSGPRGRQWSERCVGERERQVGWAAESRLWQQFRLLLPDFFISYKQLKQERKIAHTHIHSHTGTLTHSQGHTHTLTHT